MRCETAETLEDGRIVSPSAERNKAAIAAILAGLLPATGEALEVGSGTGQHVVQFARAMPHIRWRPTERDAEALRSIARWMEAAGVPNVEAPLRLDVHDATWPVRDVAAVISLNMIHIAPPSATTALVRGAGEVLAPGGVLFLYGPFRREGRHTAPSNEAFDARLKARNPDWGIRDLEDVTRQAQAAGFSLEAVHDMPANNFSLVLRKH